jgi:branched-chain amino acid transport system permease protein
MIAGLVLGGIYAISSAGLVVTYQSCGILNFSFGAMAYTIARFYYFLNSQHFWPIVPAALLSILGLGPALGLFLYLSVFRLLSTTSTPVKVLATIGTSVALPSLDTVIFGTQEILDAPGLAPEPVHVFRFLGVPVTLDQIIVYSVVVVLMFAGFFVLRYTDIGLQIRALVDSPAMTSLVGTNASRISMAVWAISSTLAGLTGVLVAPIVGLDSGQMTFVMVAAFAAVIAGRLVSLPVAVGVGLGMGVVSALCQYFLPPGSTYTADLLYAIPFHHSWGIQRREPGPWGSDRPGDQAPRNRDGPGCQWVGCRQAGVANVTLRVRLPFGISSPPPRRVDRPGRPGRCLWHCLLVLQPGDR